MNEFPFYQVGLVVPELEPAMEQLGAALGITWGEIKRVEFEGAPKGAVFSVEGPPFIELIEGRDGTAWECPDGPRLDHIGRWVPDIERAKQEFVDQGLPMSTDGVPLGIPFFAYHDVPTCGMRLELVDESRRDAFYTTMIGRQPPPRSAS